MVQGDEAVAPPWHPNVSLREENGPRVFPGSVTPMLKSVTHYLSAALTASVLALATAQAADAPPASLIQNGNFEADTNGDQIPDGWALPKNGGSWASEGANHFARLQSTKPDDMVLLHQLVKVPEGVKALELSWRMNVSGLKKGQQSWFDARIMMDFKNAAGEKMSGAPAPNVGKDTGGWVDKSVKFLVPDGARTIDFMPVLFRVAAGTFEIDDLVLKPTDAAPLEEAAQATATAKAEKQKKDAAVKQARAGAALAQGGSLISNGNFEADKKSAGWPDDWGRPKVGGTWEQENGNHFLRLAASTPGQTILMHRLIPLPATKALELSWRQRVSDLKVGQQPWFDARIMMEFQDAAGKKMAGAPGAPNTRKSTEGWVERKMEFLVPEGAVALEFMPTLFQVDHGTFDLDDFVLKPIGAEVLLAKQKQAEAERKASEVPAEQPQREKWPKELHVKGTQVLDSDDKPVWLQGVNVESLEWSARGEQVMKASLVAIDQWKANVIRLPVNEEFWNGKGASDQGAGYRELVDNLVILAANRGAYLLLDLHRFKAPKQEHAEFWKDAAARYKNHPAVIFDLFNEPHGTTWEVWRNGGFVEEKKKPGEEDAFTTAEDKAKTAHGFQAIGMQALLDAVRSTGARNVVLAGGLDYAYDLSGIAKGFALEDKSGHGIIYSTHIYPWKKGWQEKVLTTAAEHPIFVGELGANTQKMTWLPADSQEDATTWVPAILGFLQKNHFHWSAFSFHPKSGPHLLTGWDYAPTPEWGVPVKRALSGEKFELDHLR